MKSEERSVIKSHASRRGKAREVAREIAITWLRRLLNRRHYTNEFDETVWPDSQHLFQQHGRHP